MFYTTTFSPLSKLSSLSPRSTADSLIKAELAIRLVIDLVNDGESLITVTKQFGKVPRELFDVYDHILKTIIRPQNVPLTLLLVQWVLYGERPFYVEELRWATACDSDPPPAIPKFEKESFNEDVIDNARLITSLSGGLIEAVEAGVVQFIHESVREYMRDSGLRYLLQQFTGVSGNTIQYLGREEEIAGISQARLARACIACLRRSCPLLPEYAVNDGNWTAANYFPRHSTNFVISADDPIDYPQLCFLNYAERYWFRHSRKAELCGVTDQEVARQFGLPSKAGKVVFDAWAGRIRFNESGLTFRRLYKTFLEVQSGDSLSGTITLLLQNGVCCKSLGRYPDGAQDSELNPWEPIHHAASWGNLDLVKAIIETRNCSDNIRNTLDPTTAITYCAGHSPFDIAAIYGHEEILKFFLDQWRILQANNFLQAQRKPEYSPKGLQGVIQYTMEWGAEARSLPLEKKVSEEDPLKFSKIDTALRKAAREGNSEMVQQLLDWGFNPDARGALCGTALSDVAEAQGDNGLNILQTLLEYGSDPIDIGHYDSCYCNTDAGFRFDEKGRCRTWSDVKPGQCPTALSRVVFQGDKCKALVATLRKHSKLRFDPSDAGEDTLLHTAVRRASVATNVLRLLLKTSNPDVNSFVKCSFGVAWREVPDSKLDESLFETVLQAAVGGGDSGYGNVKLLIKKGADVNFRIPLHGIIDNRSTRPRKRPIERKEPVDLVDPIEPQLPYDVKKVGIDYNIWSDDEFDAMLTKATSGEADTERNWGEDVVWGRTALTRAATLGDDAKMIVRLLLSKGANPHLRRMSDCLTPLQIAEQLPENNQDVVQMLRQAMVNPERFYEDDSSQSEPGSDDEEDDDELYEENQRGDEGGNVEYNEDTDEEVWFSAQG